MRQQWHIGLPVDSMCPVRYAIDRLQVGGALIEDRISLFQSLDRSSERLSVQIRRRQLLIDTQISLILQDGGAMGRRISYHRFSLRYPLSWWLCRQTIVEGSVAFSQLVVEFHKFRYFKL